MKGFKNFMLVVFMSTAFIGFAQNEAPAPAENVEITAVDTTENQTIPELINNIGEDASPIIEAIKDPSFPPKTTAAWITFIFATLIPVLTKLLGDKAKYSAIFKNIQSSGNTNAIIVWVSIGLAGIYEGIVSQADFSFPDWGGYALLAYGFGMGIHEVIKSLSKKTDS